MPFNIPQKIHVLLLSLLSKSAISLTFHVGRQVREYAPPRFISRLVWLLTSTKQAAPSGSYVRNVLRREGRYRSTPNLLSALLSPGTGRSVVRHPPVGNPAALEPVAVSVTRRAHLLGHAAARYDGPCRHPRGGARYGG